MGPPSPARALDLGAGTGAVGRALRARFGERLEVVEVDRLASAGGPGADLSRDLPAVSGRFDLVVAAHLLNELYTDRPSADRVVRRAGRVLAWSQALLAADGLVVLIEPALRETSRELLAVRDRLLAAGLHVVAPCFWTGPCPALGRERDWCHDAAPVPSSPRVDFSYLVLAADCARSPETDARRFRVVSDPLPDKGRLRLYGCGPLGRRLLVRLDRHASPANAAFGDLRRGDAARVEGGSPSAEGLRISEETVVVAR